MQTQAQRPVEMEALGTGLLAWERHQYKDEGNIMEDPEVNRETLRPSSSLQGHKDTHSSTLSAAP